MGVPIGAVGCCKCQVAGAQVGHYRVWGYSERLRQITVNSQFNQKNDTKKVYQIGHRLNQQKKLQRLRDGSAMLKCPGPVQCKADKKADAIAKSVGGNVPHAQEALGAEY